MEHLLPARDTFWIWKRNKPLWFQPTWSHFIVIWMIELISIHSSLGWKAVNNLKIGTLITWKQKSESYEILSENKRYLGHCVAVAVSSITHHTTTAAYSFRLHIICRLGGTNANTFKLIYIWEYVSCITCLSWSENK